MLCNGRRRKSTRAKAPSYIRVPNGELRDDGDYVDEQDGVTGPEGARDMLSFAAREKEGTDPESR